MIKCTKLTKCYKSGNDDIVSAIDNTDLELVDKELVFIVGPSGSGKTTLLNVLCGLDTVDDGSIIFEDKNLTELSQKEFDEFRRKDVGIVFQNFNLFEEYNVYENIALPLKLLGVDEKNIEICVNRVLTAVHLENYGERKISELSTGQKQRVAIARAIVKQPKILFLDEPTGNLDRHNTTVIFELIKNISYDCLVIVVSHDINNAEKFADKIIHISDGKIESIRENKKTGKKIAEISAYDVDHDKIYRVTENEYITDFVRNILADYGMDLTEFNLSIRMKYDQADDKKHKDTHLSELQMSKRVSGLEFKDKVKMSLCNYKTRRIRLMITFLLFVFTSIYTLFTFTLSTYDYKKTLTTYLKSACIKDFSIYRDGRYTDIFGEPVVVNTMVGENLYKSISLFVNEKNITKSITLDEISGGTGDNDYMDVSAKIIDTANSYYTLLAGKYPVSEKEIVLSDYLAQALFPDIEYKDIIGRKINDMDYQFKVCAVTESGYLKDKDTSDANILMDKYGFAILNEKYIMELRKQSVIRLEGCNITKANSVSDYVDSKARFCSVKDITEKMMVAGKMPEADNEVLISSSLAEQIGMEQDNKFSEMSYSLLNLHDKKYNGAYDLINLYDYFSDPEVRVVGIFQTQDSEALALADIAVEDTVFQNVKNKYFSYYYYQSLTIANVDTKYLVDRFDENHIKIATTECQNIYSFDEMIHNMQKMLYLLFAVSFMIFAFFLISYVYYSISDRSVQIGIMRSLGIPINNIRSIYLYSVIALSGLTIPVSVGSYLLLIRYVNTLYDTNYMNGIGFDIIKINIPAIVVLELLFIILSYVFALIPIAKMSRRTPVDLLNSK